jgi:hypothetical protein
MRPLSASEAIQPAINRTRAVLFQPFKLGRSWKLAATAYLSTMGSYFLPLPYWIFSAGNRKPSSVLLSFGFGLLFSAVMFVFFYFGARLEFVLFDIVLLNEKFVAPSWRRHRHHSWRWIGFKMLVSLAIGIACGPVFYVAHAHLMPHLQAAMAPGQPPSPEFLRSLLGFYALIGIPTALAVLVSSLLTNFVLPSIALEDTTAREGLRRFFGLVSAEPGSFSIFVVLKLVLGIAGFIAMEMAIVIGELICLIPVALVAVAGWFLLRSAGSAGHVLMLIGAVVLLLVFLAFMAYGISIVMGALHVFFQAYALYFLAGRYPMLGDLLEPPVPNLPVATTAAPPPLPVILPPLEPDALS